MITIGIAAATEMLGVLLSQLFGISRMMFAMARKKDLAAFLEKTYPVHHVPNIGILVSGAIIILLSIF